MRIALLGLTIALISALLLLAAGPGYRNDVLTLRVAFALMRWAAYGGGVAALLALVGLLAGGGSRGKVVLPALVALVIGGVTLVVPWRWRERARTAPPIHDITTDTQNPPTFLGVLPLRADAPNSAQYGGDEIAAQQRAAYPNLGPLILDLERGAAFELALEAARAMGWDLVAADSAAGLIEATATTFWFGFKDDVVIRLTAVEGGVRIDIRSVSRVGRSDIGTNARRIQAYLERLQEAM